MLPNIITIKPTIPATKNLYARNSKGLIPERVYLMIGAEAPQIIVAPRRKA